MSSAIFAAVQMVSGNNLEDNLADAARMIDHAAMRGAQLVVLPETFAVFSAKAQLALGQQEASAENVVRRFLAQQAKLHQIWIVGGTIPLAVAGSDKVLSSCFVVDDQGLEQARYDKIHLFDVEVDDKQGSYRESDTFLAGDQPVVINTPFGRLGLAVCYDIRFPELFRLMLSQGVDIIAVPAAFTLHTGEAHWKTLLRARAIENQCYIIGANQGGEHSATRKTSGGSCIIDGWGQVLAECDKGESVVIAQMDLAELKRQRLSMPVSQHCRFNVSGKLKN